MRLSALPVLLWFRLHLPPKTYVSLSEYAIGRPFLRQNLLSQGHQLELKHAYDILAVAEEHVVKPLAQLLMDVEADHPAVILGIGRERLGDGHVIELGACLLKIGRREL